MDTWPCEPPAGSDIACITGYEEETFEVKSKCWLCAFKERYNETAVEVESKEVEKPEITTAPEISTPTEPSTTAESPRKKAKKRDGKWPNGKAPPTEPRAMRTEPPSKRKREEEGKHDQESAEAEPRSTAEPSSKRRRGPGYPRRKERKMTPELNYG